MLDKRADINNVDSFGDTPLHVAAQKNNIRMVKLLRSKGANQKIKNNKGLLPVDMTSQDEIKKLLQ